MRVLTAVVEIATLAMFDPGQDLALGRAGELGVSRNEPTGGIVALELSRNDHSWDILTAFEQLAKKLLRGPFVTPALHQDVEHGVVLIDSAPQVMALPVDGQKHFIEVPLVPWLGASTLQLI